MKKGDRVKLVYLACGDDDMPRSLLGRKGTVVTTPRRKYWTDRYRVFKVLFDDRKNPHTVFEDEVELVNVKSVK